MLKFEIKKGSMYSFQLNSPKGYTLLSSVNFNTKSDFEKITSKLDILLKENSNFERKTNHKGEFQFSLKDSDGKIIGHSQNYNSEAGMENGIKNLRSTINYNDVS